MPTTRLAWLSLLVLPGCAYQQAMKRGDAALSASDYASARRAYAFAYDTKSSDAALDGMREAQRVALQAQLSGARAAIAAGRHEEADGMLREVALNAPDNEELAAVRDDARAAMMEDMEARVADEAAEMRTTYEFVKLARRLYPDASEPEYALTTLRERTLARAAAEASEEDWSAALGTVAMVAEMEPWQQTLTSSLTEQYTTEWADDLTARGKRAWRDQPGLASIWFARAFEVAGRDKDLASSRDSWERAAYVGPVATYIDSGTQGRAVRLRSAVRADVKEVPGMSSGSSNSWDLLTKIYATDTQCKESRASERLSKDYVSGQREVPNPAYVTAKAEYDKATDAVESASMAVDKVVPQEAEATGDATRADLALKAAQRKLEDMDSVLAMGKSQQERWEADIKTVQAEIDALPSDAAGPRKAAKERLAMIERYAAEWDAKLELDRKEKKKAKDAVDAAEATLASATSKAQSLSTERAAAESTLTAARQTQASLQGRLTPLSPTMMEDVAATHEYDKHTWTNTCSSKVTVYFGTRWDSRFESPVRFEVTRTVTDTSNKGHTGANVQEDPKVYETTNGDLIAQVEAESLQRVEALVTELVDEYYAATLQKAFDGMPEDQAADVLTSIYAGAAPRMDTATREKFVALLTDRYGLESFATLAPGEAAPPMPGVTAAATAAAEPAATPAATAPTESEPETTDGEGAQTPEGDAPASVWSEVGNG